MSPSDRIKAGPHKPQLFSRESSLALFHEGPTLAVIRVSDITLNDWGITAKATVIPNPDLPPLARETWSFSCAWSCLSVRETGWHAFNIDWSLEFDPEKIKVMSAKMQTVPLDLHPGTRIGIMKAIMSGDYARADQYIQMAITEKKDPPTA